VDVHPEVRDAGRQEDEDSGHGDRFADLAPQVTADPVDRGANCAGDHPAPAAAGVSPRLCCPQTGSYAARTGNGSPSVGGGSRES
jgi:hypothetical protein